MRTSANRGGHRAAGDLLWTAFAAIALLLAGLPANRADAATKLWDGGGGNGVWTNAANWSPDGVPTISDDVIIDVPGSPVISVGTAPPIRSLLCAETITMGFGTLTVTGNATFSGLLNFLAGTIDVGGTMRIEGQMTWNAGTIKGAGPYVIASAATATWATAAPRALQKSTVVEGTVIWSGGTIDLTGDFTIAQGGLLRMNSTGEQILTAPNNTFTVNGTFEHAGTWQGGTSGIIRMGVVCNGLIKASGWSLDLDGGTTPPAHSMAGTLQIEAGTTVTVNQAWTYDPGAALVGPGVCIPFGVHDFPVGVLQGVVVIVSTGNEGIFHEAVPASQLNHQISGIATFTVPQVFDSMTLTGSTAVIRGERVEITQSLTTELGTLAGTNEFVIDEGAVATMHNSAIERPFIINGTVTWTGVEWKLVDPVHVTSTGVLKLWPDTSGSLLALGGSVLNEGTVEVNGNTFVKIYVPFENAGTMILKGSTTQWFGAGGVQRGTLDIRAAAKLSLSTTLAWESGCLVTGGGTFDAVAGTHVLPAGSFALTGTLAVSGATVTLIDAVGNPGPKLSMGSGTLSMSGPLSLNGATIQGGTLTGAGNLTLDGTCVWSGGTVTGTGTCTVLASGLLKFEGTGIKTLDRPLSFDGGLFQWTGGKIALGDVITIGPNATWTAPNTGLEVTQLGGGSIVNHTETTFAGSLQLKVPYEHTVTNHVTGTLGLAGGCTHHASFDVAASGDLQFLSSIVFSDGADLIGPGKLTLGGGVTVIPQGAYKITGKLNLAGGGMDVTLNDLVPSFAGNMLGGGTLRLNVSQTIDLTNILGGTIAGLGTITLPPSFTLGGGGFSGSAPLVVLPGSVFALNNNGTKTITRPVELNGQMNWQQGTLSLGAPLHITATGVLTITPSTGSPAISNPSGAGSIINDGLITHPSGQSVSISAPLTNNGTLEIAKQTGLGGGSPQLVNGTLSGGTWKLGAQLFFPNPTPITGLGAGSVVEFLTANSITTSFQTLSHVDAGASLAVKSGPAAALTPAGGTLVNGGAIEIASGSALAVNGAYSQSAGGSLQATLATSSSLPLHATNSVLLDGHLGLSLAANFSPADPSTQPIVVGTSRTGEFASVDAPAPPSVLHQPSIQYGNVGANLVVALEPSAFVGPAGGSWFDVQHWASGQLPGEHSKVVVNVPVTIDGPGAVAGQVHVLSGGSLRLADPGASLVAGTVDIAGGGSINWIAGTLTLLERLTSVEPLVLGEAAFGHLILRGGLLDVPALVVGVHGIADLDGTVTGDCTVAGRLAVGACGDVPPDQGLACSIRGELAMSGDLTILAGGELGLELGAPSDALSVAGTANIDGVLDLGLIAGDEVAAGESAVVLSANALTGARALSRLAASGPIYVARSRETNAGPSLRIEARQRPVLGEQPLDPVAGIAGLSTVATSIDGTTFAGRSGFASDLPTRIARIGREGTLELFGPARFEPRAVTVDLDGDFAATDAALVGTAEGELVQIDSAGNGGGIGASPSPVEDLCVDGSGRLLVAGGTIAALGQPGGELEPLVTAEGAWSRLTPTYAGGFIASNDAVITEFTATGEPLPERSHALAGSGAAMAYAAGIPGWLDGLWWIDRGDGVLRHRAITGVVREVASGLFGISDMSFAPDGRLLLAADELEVLLAAHAPQAMVADFDGNGIVDGADLTALLAAWGTGDANADLDGSGIVDTDDLAILLGSWRDPG